jgi:hypothetical protein
MKIGIDFDNTIAGYDPVFVTVAAQLGLLPADGTPDQGAQTKATIKQYLLSSVDGDQHWQRVQGLVYGQFMHKAEVLSGAWPCMSAMQAAGHELFIVSHKTEFGHFDPDRVPLRIEAMKWMAAQAFFDETGLGLSRDRVFFEPTRDLKIDRIRDLRLDIFIDDLVEVLDDPAFPSGTKPILFDPQVAVDHSGTFIKADWPHIQEIVLGN